MSETKVTGGPVNSPKCSECGTPLPTGALAGLCPACLLKQGAAEDSVTDGAGKPFIPPTVAELAPLFPQLEILELIGKGGMGAVYKARQKQLDRFVALKILPPGIGEDPSFAERFAREARALAKLNHPGIVTLYEFGQVGGNEGGAGSPLPAVSDDETQRRARSDAPYQTTPSGSRPSTFDPRLPLYFFLMEFVDGVNLRQLLHAGRISAREALAIVPQICDALQFAHDQGIVHRDIKPENILMDRRGRVKVADFGLAKIVGNDAPLSPSLSPSDGERVAKPGEGTPVLTDAGKVMGTPHYMSPEQIEAPGEVDHRSDIYALGVVFYQMLTGELPGKKIEPPSKKVHIDVRLDEVVLRALEKKPELRYQQASVLKTQVETIAATPDASGSRVKETLVASSELTQQQQRWRWVKAGVFFFAAVSMFGSAAYSAQHDQAVRAAFWFIGSVGFLIAGIRRIPRAMSSHAKNEPTTKAAPNPPAQPRRWLKRIAVGLALVLALGGGVVFYFSQQLLSIGGMIWTDSPDGRYSARGGAERAMRIFGSLNKSTPSASPAIVVAVEQKLQREIQQRLNQAGWQPESLSVIVSPDLKRAECRFGTIWKNGLSQPYNAGLRLEPQGGGLWQVRGEGEFWSLHFSVDTAAVMVADRGALPPMTTSTTNFGPREVVMGRLGLRTDCCLDFDTGRVLTPPSDLAQSYVAGNGYGATPGETLRMHDWMRESGADVMLMPDGGLVLFDGIAGDTSGAFDDVDVQREIAQMAALEKRFNQNRTQPPVPTVQNMQPLERGRGGVWRFKTHEGNTGLLEILEAGKDADHLRLRYKLVQSATSMLPSSNPASAAIPKEQGMAISFSNCPVSDALLNLAKDLKLNCVLDPQLLADWKRNPAAATVNASWTNITAAQAFNALLDNYRLQATTNAQTSVVCVSAKGPAGEAAAFEELGLPFPTLEVVAGWNGEIRVLPNPIAILSAWRRTEDYGDWLGKRDVRTFTHTNSAGYQFEIHALALARSDGHLSETLTSFGIRRPNGSMLASVPRGGSGDWAQWGYDVYNEDGRTEVARVSVTIDAQGKSRVSRVVWNPESPDKLEWEVNPLGVAWSELEWSEAEKKWEQRQFVRELGHAPYRKTELAPSAFGPVREVTLHDSAAEALDLETGRTVALDRDLDSWPEDRRSRWIKESGMDLYVNSAPWRLLTPGANATRLVLVSNTAWTAMDREQFDRELIRGNAGVPTESTSQVTVHVLGTNPAPPLTFTFATANDARGLLQITGFTDNPRGVKLRYKLVQNGSDKN
jgi:serine/threonine protein kinase